MKALIFNSGLGSRLGELTAHNPKCLVHLASGETILHRQLRVLSACGLRDFVLTTGPWPEQVEAVCREFEAAGCRFAFVRNDIYDQTNYLHSMWLAREELRGHEVLVLHGDLVFDAAYVTELLELPAGSYGSVDPALPVPEKDFSADVDADGYVRRVGVGIDGEQLMAFQSMYRLTPEALGVWLDEVEAFEARGETGVYAENAANEVFGRMRVMAHPYTRHVLEEIDTPEDLERVSAMIRARDFADQPTFVLADGSSKLVEGCAAGRVRTTPRLGSIVAGCGIARPLVVADSFLSDDDLAELLGDGEWPRFSAFSPNPTYEQVLGAVRAFRDGSCDGVVSVGGGSAIDVAKCVKLWAGLPGDGTGTDGWPRLCDQEPRFSALPHVAVPTTAGTGSESTHFAVVYVDGEKRSVAADCLQPDVAVLVPRMLLGLPARQRGATMLDALCQAIESHWSTASSEASRVYSKRAMELAVECWNAYLAGKADAARAMHVAANLAGRAINLTTTTAAHAMSYKLTSLYGIPHGHAVALCLPFAWRTLEERGSEETHERLREIEAELGAGRDEGLARFLELREATGLATTATSAATTRTPEPGDAELLAASVNAQRLGNFPVPLTHEELVGAYEEILGA